MRQALFIGVDDAWYAGIDDALQELCSWSLNLCRLGRKDLGLGFGLS
jgi:hypothetical protein